VHRDLKPANIMLSPAGVKLLDFGIAKLLDAASHETVAAPGTVIGTPAYMSPEQFRGEAADQRSDIFSFGAILHEIFSGAPAFVSPRQGAIPVRQPVAGLPAELEQIIARCLSANRHDRYPSMQQVKQELENPQLAVSISICTERRPLRDTVDITGTWISEDYYFQGSRRAVFKFKRYGPAVGGVVDVLEKKNVNYGPFERYNVHGAISEVSINGDQISFTALMRVDGILGTTPAEYPLRFAGVISVDLLKLAILYKDGQAEFTAMRSSDSQK
jgi:serine/threonine protein kinase